MVQRFDGAAFDGLSRAMVKAFADDGVFVLDGLIDPAVCASLMERMTSLVAQVDPETLTHFFSTVTDAYEQDSYFLESAKNIHFFLEKDVVDDAGQLKRPLRHSLNKVGHALHEKDDVFNAFSHQKHFSSILSGLQKQPKIIQSMYIFKSAGIGGEVVCHQDSTYLWTEPQSCVALWLALEDATIENGCLWGMPGAHKESEPRARFRKLADGTTRTDILNSAQWAKDKCVPLEVKRGGLVVFHGQFPHLSGPNISPFSREAYTLHSVDTVAKIPQDNWLF